MQSPAALIVIFVVLEVDFFEPESVSSLPDPELEELELEEPDPEFEVFDPELEDPEPEFESDPESEVFAPEPELEESDSEPEVFESEPMPEVPETFSSSDVVEAAAALFIACPAWTGAVPIPEIRRPVHKVAVIVLFKSLFIKIPLSERLIVQNISPFTLCGKRYLLRSLLSYHVSGRNSLKNFCRKASIATDSGNLFLSGSK